MNGETISNLFSNQEMMIREDSILYDISEARFEHLGLNGLFRDPYLKGRTFRGLLFLPIDNQKFAPSPQKSKRFPEDLLRLLK